MEPLDSLLGYTEPFGKGQFVFGEGGGPTRGLIAAGSDIAISKRRISQQKGCGNCCFLVVPMLMAERRNAGKTTRDEGGFPIVHINSDVVKSVRASYDFQGRIPSFEDHRMFLEHFGRSRP